jgi:hypothetical protein
MNNTDEQTKEEQQTFTSRLNHLILRYYKTQWDCYGRECRDLRHMARLADSVKDLQAELKQVQSEKEYYMKAALASESVIRELRRDLEGSEARANALSREVDVLLGTEGF